VGIIEIFTKKGPDIIEVEKPISENKTSTIFWKPDIITDSSGKASISFSNKQSSTVYISVEGNAANGLAGSSTIEFTVK